MKYEITQKARNDLIGIWEYTYENWSHQQADKYYEILIEKIEEITSRPHIGKNYERIKVGLRGVKVKSHIVFYRIENDTVEIIRVLHKRMDLENRLND